MLNMACTCFRMTPEEALAGVMHAATALGMGDTHGSLEVGKVADFVAWQIDRPADLAYWLGGDLDKRVVRTASISGEQAVDKVLTSNKAACRC
jgi:imidazolonepropionase